ncbi:MAG: permease [Chloroflexota bacterium]|nr:permease [Chloroflexota bacterium]
MTGFPSRIGEAILMAFGMFWDVGWSLVLGFVISGLIQALVSQQRMRELLGRDGIKEIVLATGFGAASSSCSYASAAISRSLFKKGAALVPSLAFLFSSTNLVIELGIILWLLMGWQFTAAEWIGGIVLIAVMAVLVRLTYPKRLVEDARRHPEQGGGHEHSSMPLQGDDLWDKLRRRETWIRVAQNVAMDTSMLWKDLVGGFLIAGFLSAFVPNEWWAALFLKGASPWVQVPVNAVVGPIVAIISFVCSIGNVPLAAVLWASGISFGGVLAFLYADLIVLPLLDVYRRYYGWKMAAYIGGVFFVTMVLAGLVMDVVFTALGLVPRPNPNIRAEMVHFSLNYTFWLNVLFAAVAGWLFWLNHTHPMEMHNRGGHQGHPHAHRRH